MRAMDSRARWWKDMGLHRDSLGEREAQKTQDESRSPSFSCLGSLIKFAYWCVLLDIDITYRVETRREAEM